MIFFVFSLFLSLSLVRGHQVHVLQPSEVTLEGEELGEEDISVQHLLVRSPGRWERHVQGEGPRDRGRVKQVVRATSPRAAKCLEKV